MEAAHQVIERPGFMDALEKAAERIRLPISIIDNAVFPRLNQVNSIANVMARHVAPFEVAMKAERQWQRALAVQMRNIHRPWILQEYATASLEGFAKLSRLNDALRTGDPFEASTRLILDEDLGSPAQVDEDDGPEKRDAASVDAGFAPELLAFPAATSGEVLIETGFIFQADYSPLPTPIDGSDPGLLYHPSHGYLITTVEQNLRHLIISKLSIICGPNWMKRKVDKTVTDRWRKRQDEAVDDGEVRLDLIHYADFMDLKDIIAGKDNWNEAFGAIFIRKNHFTVSMERLHPIRKPLAHGRPIGRAQQLVLVAEATLILKALNISILK
jgi:hypothetical protein